MKSALLIVFLFCLSFLSFSQLNPTLDSLKSEFHRIDSIKTDAEYRANELKARIEKLSPPPLINPWKTGGFMAVNFNQMNFDNWAGGGVNAVSVTTLGNLFFNYKKGKVSWANNIDLAYGMIQNKGQGLRKNEDKIDYLTKFGYTSPVKNVNYAILANFKSQFAPSYSYNDKNEKSPMISKFMSPAFVLASLGIDWKPKPYLSFYISPATGKFTIVSISDTRIKTAFAVDSNKTVRSEFGALMNIFFQKDVYKNVNWLSRVSLFNNYTDKNTANRKNIDVNFENMITTKLGKYVTASLFLNWIYDDDILISYDENDASKKGPRLQFKEVFGVGFSYKLDKKRKK
jgi:hypothetical protein